MQLSLGLKIDTPQVSDRPKLAASSEIGTGRSYPIDLPTLWAAAKEDPPPPPQKPAPDNAPEIAVQKSYWIPALEIVGFDFLLNRFNRHVEQPRRLRRELVVDQTATCAKSGSPTTIRTR